MKDIVAENSEESFIIESHFEVPENYISLNTRNKCSEDLVSMINEVARILYPNENFQIYSLPPKRGCYLDSLKMVGAISVGLVPIGGLVLAYLSYRDNHEKHEHDKKIWKIEDLSKCIALKRELSLLEDNTGEIFNISDKSLEEICGSSLLQKKKNNRARILRDDSLVSAETSILKKEGSSKFILKKKLNKEDFEKCIEAMPEKEGYYRDGLQGNIELISLVVKQKKEGQGRMWSGTYYGEEIIERGIVILSNGEVISFYMQDEDFKTKISQHEISFKEGDNINSTFNLKAVLNIDFLENKKIYITRINKFNEDIVKYKDGIRKNNRPKVDELQSVLF